jgi:hypothetical protein
MTLDRFYGYLKHSQNIAVIISTAVFILNLVMVGEAWAVVTVSPAANKPVEVTVIPTADHGPELPAMQPRVNMPPFMPPVLSPFTIFKLPGFIPVRPPGFNPLLRPNLFLNGDDSLDILG